MNGFCFIRIHWQFHLFLKAKDLFVCYVFYPAICGFVLYRNEAVQLLALWWETRASDVLQAARWSKDLYYWGELQSTTLAEKVVPEKDPVLFTMKCDDSDKKFDWFILGIYNLFPI